MNNSQNPKAHLCGVEARRAGMKGSWLSNAVDPGDVSLPT